MIAVELEPEDIRFMHPETCCFCRQTTRYWYQGQVACCQNCARVATPEAVPDKKTWMAGAEVVRKVREGQHLQFNK